MCSGGNRPSNPQGGRAPDSPVDSVESRCCEGGITGLSVVEPCRFIPWGKTCRFEASGEPAGGTYSWSAANGVSISGPSNTKTVQVRGNTTSAAVDAATLTVTYRCGAHTRTETVHLTVFRITELKTTVKPTPPNTVRVGFAAPADHHETIRVGSLDFRANEPVVLMRCPNRSVALEATALPAGLPLNWHRQRSAADHANLGGAGDLPTITPDAANRLKATLMLDQKGSFHIRPFVACKGDDTFDADHAPRCLNLVLADATVVRDRSAAHPGALSVQRENVWLSIINGAWGNAPLSADSLANAGMAMELVSDVTGGGADGRLGLDKVFCGLVNNVMTRNVFFHYTNTAVAPATHHRIRLIAVSNPNAATGNDPDWGTFFRTADPAPVLHDLPLLDTGLDPAGVGADTALMTRSQADPSTRILRPVGERWTTRCIDSPSTPMPRNHLGTAQAVMSSIDYTYRFKAAFCFWTNRGGSRGQTGETADRTYTVLRLFEWEIRGVWNVTNWPVGALPTLNATTPHTITKSNEATAAPMERAKHDRSIEVRPPSGVSAGLSRDAQ
jgi:hypothetical protein